MSQQLFFALLGRLLYAVPAVLTLAVLGLGIIWARNHWLKFPRRPYLLAGALLSLLLTWLAGETFTPAARVQWDEADLYSTSLSMHFSRSALIPTMALPGPTGPRPVEFSISKRPPMFPFLTSVLHSLFGPAPENALAVNRLVLFLLLFLAFAAALSVADTYTAAAAPLLLCSSPVLFWVCTSGGMDPLATLSVLCLAVAAGRFWRAPGREAFLLLMMMGAFASHTRYETGPIFALFLVPCLLQAWKRKELRKSMAIYGGLTLLLLLPLLSVLLGPALRFDEARGRSLLSLGKFLENFPLFLKSFFLPSLGGPFSPLVNIAGVLALIGCRKKILPPFQFLLLACAFSLLLALFYFEGNPNYFSSVRLYLLPATALCLLPLLLRLHLWPQKRAGQALLAFAAAACLLQLQPLFGKKLFPDGWTATAAERVRELVRARQGQRDLYLFSPSLFLISEGAAVVSPDYFAENHAGLMSSFARGEFTGIYWILVGQELELEAAAAARQFVTEQYHLREVASVPLLPAPIKVYSIERR